LADIVLVDGCQFLFGCGNSYSPAIIEKTKEKADGEFISPRSVE
jgi:hypothetical protein